MSMAARYPLANSNTRGRLALTVLVCAALVLSLLPTNAFAQSRISILRDAEVEALVRDYASPILRAAGLGRSNIEVVLVNDRDFNAFVADGRRIFINVGVMLQSDTPNEVIGVLAHETGHLAGSHLSRLRQEISRAQTIAAISTLIGAIAMAAGAASGDGSAASAGQGIALGGASIAQRTLLAYQRDEELSADRAAVSYLNATGQSARGMLEVFRGFAGQTMFTGQFVDPYVRSHPMATERISQIERLAQQSPYFNQTDPPSLQLRHDLAVARLTANLEGAGSVSRRYPRSDTSLPARYARALAEGARGSVRDAIAEIDRLIREQPSNPYFWESRGNILFENADPRGAAQSWQQALQLAPNDDLLRVYFGAALVEMGDDSILGTAIGELERGLANDTSLAFGYRFLAQAYARQGNTAMAQLASGLEAFSRGDINGAKGFAARAQQQLARGSTGWLRAQDILTYDE